VARRGHRPAAAALAIAGAVLVAAAASGAVKPPSGDVAAGTFYRKEAAVYSKLAGAKVVETGYFFGSRSRGGGISFTWGQPPKPGYVAQKAEVLEELSDGKVVAYMAKLTGHGLKRIRVLMAGGDVFLSSSSCWKKAPASFSPFGTGETYLFNDGGAHFMPLDRNHAGTTTTFTYAWAPGAQAREVDTFSRGTRPTVQIHITVAGAQAMHIGKTITPLVNAPELPVPTPPAVPVPKPMCGNR